ncbi:unnamed protein product, partial [Arabidopsis halleri]
IYHNWKEFSKSTTFHCHMQIVDEIALDGDRLVCQIKGQTAVSDKGTSCNK